MKKNLLAIAMMMLAINTQAQTSVAKELLADPNRAAGSFYALPVGQMPKDTPAPEGKKPFYINHYGSPCSYYHESKTLYEQPYAVFAKADSLGKLTKLGRDVKRRLNLLRHGRTHLEGCAAEPRADTSDGAALSRYTHVQRLLQRT